MVTTVPGQGGRSQPVFPRTAMLVCGAWLFSHVQLCKPTDCGPLGSSVHRDSPGRNTGQGCRAPVDLANPEIEPRSRALRADSLPSEPPGKPKNTGVSSLSLLQGIFLTQEPDQGLLHCRWILYQLSYQGSLNNYATCSQ